MSYRLTGSQEKVHLRLTWRPSRSASLPGDTGDTSQPAAGAYLMPMLTDKEAHKEEAGEPERKVARR